MIIKELSTEIVQKIKDEISNFKGVNLSGHQIQKFENLELLDKLQTFNVSNNKITGSLVGLN